MAKFLSDLIGLSLSKGGIIIFSLLRAVILARWLGPEGNGIITAITLFPALFITIGSLGVRQSTTFFVGKEAFTIERIQKAIFQIWILSSIICVLGSFFLMKHFVNLEYDFLLIVLALLPIPFNLFNTYNSGVFLGNNQIKAFNRINWVPTFIVLLFTTILLVIYNLGIYAAIFATSAGPIFMSFFLMYRYKLLKYFSIKFDIIVISSLIRLGIIYAFVLLIVNLNYKIDIFMMDHLSTKYELGIYSKGSQLSEYLWQIPMLLGTLIFARSASSKNDLLFSLKVSQLLRLSIIVVGVLCVIILLLSKQIILLLFGIEFIESSIVQIILIPGVLLLIIYKVLYMDLAGKGKPWVSLKPMIPALILNVGMNYFMIPEYGAKGAAISSTLSYSFASILFLYFYSKEVSIPITQIFNFSKNDYDFLKTMDLFKGKR